MEPIPTIDNLALLINELNSQHYQDIRNLQKHIDLLENKIRRLETNRTPAPAEALPGQQLLNFQGTKKW